MLQEIAFRFVENLASDDTEDLTYSIDSEMAKSARCMTPTE